MEIRKNAIAWDMYLFYEKGSNWDERPPLPLDWVHQLDDAWVDPDHFAWGDDLIAKLREIVKNLKSSN